MHNTKIDHLNYGTYANPNGKSFKSSFSNEIRFSSLNQKDLPGYNFASSSTEQPVFHKGSNNYASYAFANEKSYYDLDKQQDLSTSSVINDSYNSAEFEYFGDEDLCDKFLHTDLISNNTTDFTQLDKLSANKSSSNTFISKATHNMSNDECYNDLFQGFLNYSPEELFDHLSPQETKLFDEKSHEISIDSEELDIFTQPQKKKREISVIASRKSTRTYPFSRCSKILTDFPLNNVDSCNRFLSNSFLKELYFHSGISPSDSENYEKNILSFTKDAKQSSNSRSASQSRYIYDIRKPFEIPVVTVNAVILQDSVTPISEIGIYASKSMFDRFVPRSASCQSAYEIPIFNSKTVDTAEERNKNINFKKISKPETVSAESSLKGTVKSLSSEAVPNNSSTNSRDKIWDVGGLDTPTFWANCDLKNITLEAPDHSKMAVKTDVHFSPTKLVQDIGNYKIPTRKNTKTELPNKVDINARSLKLSFESHTKDETPLLALKKPGNNRMFKMSVRENPLTSSKPSWYITSYDLSATANDEISTSSAKSFSDSIQLASKSISGIPVSSIYFCTDKTVKSLFSEAVTTGSIVKQQANNIFSKPLENDEKKAVKKNIVENMNLKPPVGYYKSKYTAQVEHNFVECFKEIDDFVQQFDAKTEIIVSNGAAAIAAATSVKNITRKTPISLNDCKKKASSLKSQYSVGIITKPTTSSAPANLNIGSEKKHNVVAELKHSFSKDIDKLKSHSSKDTIFNELLQSVPERSLTERKLTRRHEPITPYEKVIKELTREIDTLKSMRSRQVSEHMKNDSPESFEKAPVYSSKPTGYRKMTTKKTQLFTDSSDNVADEKNENKGGKKLREVLHAVKVKVKCRLTNEKT